MDKGTLYAVPVTRQDRSCELSLIYHGVSSNRVAGPPHRSSLANARLLGVRSAHRSSPQPELVQIRMCEQGIRDAMLMTFEDLLVTSTTSCAVCLSRI